MTSILPQPETQFIDGNGNPFAGGKVYTQVPLTSNPKNTWQDADQVVLNQNPIILDADGRCLMYGSGIYRIILTDADDNEIYDQLTASTLAENVISVVMLPVVGAATLATARTLMGIDDEIQNAINSIQLLTGPTGPHGPTGPTGAKGDTGSPSGTALDIQTFTDSGTWTKPVFGSIVKIEIWGAGAAGTDAAGGFGGAGGGFMFVENYVADFTATVAVTIGTGGVFVLGNAGPGANGTNTSFGSYIVMAGGSGGSLDTAGASGYVLSQSGLNPLTGSYESCFPPVITADGYGNTYASVTFSGTSGANFAAPIPSIFGGTGGTYPGGNGAYPGGGGAVNGGNGANGMVRVTTY